MKTKQRESTPLVKEAIRVYFHELQLAFKPLYEWAFGEKIPHPETTSRAESILWALRADDAHYIVESPEIIDESLIHQVHDKDLVRLYHTASQLSPEGTFYPSVFPGRESMKLDPSRIEHAGGYCFDSGTPLNAMTLEAATWSAACAYQAAQALKQERLPVTYALSRPPGHHATREAFGGYCYFNNAGIAAHYLRQFGKVLILDIDFHHGNGTQQLFYRDADVFVMSIHGDPQTFYPYFSGYEEELGAGPGKNFNCNVVLPARCDGSEYLRVLRQRVIPTIDKFKPDFLILSAGHDTYANDPVGNFALLDEDFHELGQELGRLKYPTLVIQEGGYCTAELGRIVHVFLEGLRSAKKPPA